MSQALIAVTERQIGGETVQSADGRELHAFLGIAKDFNQWMREQIARARLVEGRDYLTYEVVVQLSSGAKRRKECALTIDAAKHVSMMSGSDKGFEVREYFIECEHRALAQPKFQIPTTLSGALRLAADQAEQIERQAAQIEAQKPAVEFVEKYVAADGPKGFREVCKLLGANESEFRQFLISNSIMYRLNGRLMPMAHHHHAGRFEVKAGVSDTNNHAFNQAMFTPKGIAWIAEKWAEYQSAHA